MDTKPKITVLETDKYVLTFNSNQFLEVLYSFFIDNKVEAELITKQQ